MGKIVEAWITKKLQDWDKVKSITYLVVWLGWFLCLVLGLVVYISPVDAGLAFADLVVIIVSIILIGIIELDLITEALKVTVSPERLAEKLAMIYPAMASAIKSPNWQNNYEMRCILVRDMCNEFEAFWWKQKSYRSLTSIIGIFVKILLVIGFFALISISYYHLSNFQSLAGVDPHSPRIDYFTHYYISAEGLFLTGHDNIIPNDIWSHILTIAEEIAGFLTLAVAVVRLITPVDDEVRRFRQAIMWRFQTPEIVTCITTEVMAPEQIQKVPPVVQKEAGS